MIILQKTALVDLDEKFEISLFLGLFYVKSDKSYIINCAFYERDFDKEFIKKKHQNQMKNKLHVQITE